MTLLRIYASLLAPPSSAQRYPWALLSHHQTSVTGVSSLDALPHHATQTQLVIPAQEILLTRVPLPAAARRHSDSLLAYAVEAMTVGEPDRQQVSWLGKANATATQHGEDVLAVLDKSCLQQWLAALRDVGIDDVDVHSEILLLPLKAGEWSLAWHGSDGFVRSGELEGIATDCGDRTTPPLALRMLLDQTNAPAAMAIYCDDGTANDKTADKNTPDKNTPDCAAWSARLGIPVYLAGSQDWRHAPVDAGTNLVHTRQRWRIFNGMAARLRPTAWIIGATLALQAIALLVDWSQLNHEKHALQQQMEKQFRALFPDAVAVTDPALQMRRKLAEAHDAAGQFDNGNFLPMLEHVALAMKSMPASSVRTVSYESGRMTLEISGADAQQLLQLSTQLQQAGLQVETGKSQASAGNTATIIVRAA
ncbi:MAG TPA: type II secretion system protein GspL [Pseudomonadales bacterium]|nr:type II secretion system protein GspL [Pseudomonadales bacterium]